MSNNRRLRVLGQAFAWVLVLAATPVIAETPDRYLALTHPAVKWMSRAELPDALEQYNQYKEGAGAYARGLTRDGRTRYSMVIHRYPGASDARSCRDSELANIRKNPLTAQLQIDTAELGGAAYLRTHGTITTGQQTGYTQHVHRYLYRDGLCVKLHVSSSREGAETALALTQAADSLLIMDAPIDITRVFYVAPKAALKLVTPAHWGFDTSDPSTGPVRNIKWVTADGQFQLLLSVFARPPGQSELTDSVIRKTVESARERLAGNALQTTMEMQVLKGREAEGLYVFATDKKLVGQADKPGDWRHVRQGMLKLASPSPLVATFSVFSNREESPDAAAAMRVLENLGMVVE